MFEAILFYLASTLMVASALCVILLKKPMRAVLCLILTLFSLAVLFILLEAYFIAMIHILVYAGAIVVLFLFVIMLLGIRGHPEEGGQLARDPLAGTISLGVILSFLGEILWILKDSGSGMVLRSLPSGGPQVPVVGTIEAVGELLFTQYLLPFELTSFLLLVGILGAITLARKEPSP